MNDLDFIATPGDFTRLNNDLSGNPRYALNHCYLLTPLEAAERRKRLNECRDIKEFRMIFEAYYLIAIRRANSIDGRKYDTKAYRSGLCFTSHSLPELCDHIAYRLYRAHAIATDQPYMEFTAFMLHVRKQAINALYPPKA